MQAARSPKPSWKKEFLQFFGSVKLVITLLLTIAAASVIGTILPQDQGPGVVINAHFHPMLKALLLGIQAYDMYHSPWFDFLLGMLFLNLAVCTYLRFPATWRRYQMKVPAAPPLSSLQECLPLGAPPSEERLNILRKRGYKVSPLKDGLTFAEKAKFVRLAPTFIHISLFAIILGAIIGGQSEMKNSVSLQIGQVVNSQAIFDSAIKGRFAPPIPSFDLRLDGFRMDFYPNGIVKQYYSDLTVMPAHGVPYHTTLWVNEPMIHEGVYFYQAFYGIGALDYTVDGKRIDRLAVTQTKIGFISRPFQMGGERYVFFMRTLNDPGLLIDTADFKPASQVVPGVPVTIKGHTLKIEQYRLFSGLQTKRDPGIPLVYFGCGVLLLGLAMVPVSHRELWVRPTEQGWMLGGRTYKGRVMLLREMEQIADKWGAEAPAEDNLKTIGATAS